METLGKSPELAPDMGVLKELGENYMSGDILHPLLKAGREVA